MTFFKIASNAQGSGKRSRIALGHTVDLSLVDSNSASALREL
jgi:hypothetical protein